MSAAAVGKNNKAFFALSNTLTQWKRDRTLLSLSFVPVIVVHVIENIRYDKTLHVGSFSL